MRSRLFGRCLVSGGLVGAVLVGSLTVVPAALNGNPRNGGPPVIAKPVAAPAQPAAGKPFTVSFKVTRSDNGRPFLRGRMTGDPSIAGRVVQHTESFRAGTARVSLAVPTNAIGKTLRVTVAIRDGATKVTRVATYRIQGRPSVSVGDASVAEGNAGTTPLSFPVTLSAASTQPVSVTYATADGTATAPSDYTAANGTLTFDPGETSKTISVNVAADLAIEQDEALAVTISGAVGATIAGATATGRITNDDTQVPVSAGAYKGIIEGNALFLDVVDRYVTHFRSNYVRMDCGSTGTYVYGDLDWGDSRFTIRPDGSFSASADSNGTVSGSPAKYHDEITGRFDGTNVSGTVLGSVEFDSDGTHLSCTSGQRPWTASFQG
jgi:hypothetical protein